MLKRETTPRFACAGLRLAPLLLSLAIGCASSTQPASKPPAREADATPQAAAACTNVARDQGLHVVEIRSWTKTSPDRWSAKVLVRPESGGLSYEMDCSYNPSRDRATLNRP